MVGDIYHLEIEKLDHYGRGISRLNGKIVFIPYTLPKEVVDIKIKKDKKKYMEASLLKIIESSPERMSAICPYFQKCGGCDLLHMSYEKQRLFKENKVKEILYKFGSIDIEKIKPILFSDSITYYRNKASFKVEDKIGFYEKKSNDIIEVDNCKLVHPKIQEIIEKLKNQPILSFITDIIIRVSSIEESMLILVLKQKIEASSLDFIKDDVDTIVVFDNNKYSVLTGKGFIKEKVGTYIFKISPTSFFQVNLFTTALLYDKVYEYVSSEKKQNVLDLYCGTGTLGIYVSDMALKIFGIEINQEAVEDARENADNNQILNSKFMCQNICNIRNTTFENEKMDVIIVDPPRAGLEGNVISFLIEKKANRIVYVSCDPVTLARDLKKLQEAYDVVEISPIDMFPNTYHVECVCVLNRR